MEKEKNNEEKAKMNNFNGLVIRKLNGEILETPEENSKNFINDYEAKLAVLDDNGNPYGEVDNLLIIEQPGNLIIKRDEGRASIDIMSEAIKEASDLGLKSIALSTDTLEEIETVKKEIIEILVNNRQIEKIGFYYPKDTK